jgi:hypothetical protein
MARKKKTDPIPTQQELEAEYRILKEKLRESVPSTRKLELADAEEILASLRTLRESNMESLGKAETERLLLERLAGIMEGLEILRGWEHGERPEEAKPKGQRLELDEARECLRIDAHWFPYGGGDKTTLLRRALAAKGEPQPLHVLVSNSHPDRVFNSLPDKIKEIFDNRRGSKGGHWILPEYFE